MPYRVDREWLRRRHLNMTYVVLFLEVKNIKNVTNPRCTAKIILSKWLIWIREFIIIVFYIGFLSAHKSYLAQQLDSILQQIVIEVLVQVQQHVHADVFQRKPAYYSCYRDSDLVCWSAYLLGSNNSVPVPVWKEKHRTLTFNSSLFMICGNHCLLLAIIEVCRKAFLIIFVEPAIKNDGVF